MQCRKKREDKSEFEYHCSWDYQDLHFTLYLRFLGPNWVAALRSE